MKKIQVISSIIFLILFMGYYSSCKKDELSDIENETDFSNELLDYQIYQGNPADLIPSSEFKLYDIATPLFSDYAEKQRLIKIPQGTKLISNGNGLPKFPEGTILVKTFYYYNDKRDASKGRKIVETRLLILSNSKWSVATYLWNREQTAARLVTGGLNTTINWINENGKSKVISYHVPGNRECATCHNSDGAIIPIGPKLRNLNMDVMRNGSTINQFTYLKNQGIMDSLNPLLFSQLPNWEDLSQTLESRAKAYLDVNCAHCHSANAYASTSGIYFNYDLSADEAHIKENDSKIINMISIGAMPKLGTSLIDEEGMALIKTYIESL